MKLLEERVGKIYDFTNKIFCINVHSIFTYKSQKTWYNPMSARDEWINELYIITMECYTEIKIMK